MKFSRALTAVAVATFGLFVGASSRREDEQRGWVGPEHEQRGLHDSQVLAAWALCLVQRAVHDARCQVRTRGHVHDEPALEGHRCAASRALEFARLRNRCPRHHVRRALVGHDSPPEQLNAPELTFVQPSVTQMLHA